MSAEQDELREIFARLGRGDLAALSDLLDRWAAAMGSYAMAFVGDQQEAEDAVMDVIAALASAGPRLARVRNPKAYLFAAVRRAAMRRRRPRLAGARMQAQTCTDPADAAAVRQAVATLPLEQREVLVLKAYCGLTFAEIAELLRISRNTAASRYRYALEKLRKLLGGCSDDA